MKELDREPTKEIATETLPIKDLFDHGRETFGGIFNGSAAEYFNEEDQKTVTRPKLPAKFASLVLGDNPNQYYVAYYDDRRSEYFLEETREQSICLSTQEKKYIPSGRVRQITYSEKADGMYVKVEERINNHPITDFLIEDDERLVKPTGGMNVQYKISDTGEKTLVNFSADRFEEAIIGKEQARLGRTLKFDLTTGDIDYTELYTLKRAEDTDEKEQANIKFQVTGGLDAPESITISVGYGETETARTLFEDNKNKMKAVVHSRHEKDLALLRTDPKYSFWDENDGNTKEVTTFLKERVKLLQQHWNSQQSMYIKPKALHN